MPTTDDYVIKSVTKNNSLTSKSKMAASRHLGNFRHTSCSVFVYFPFFHYLLPLSINKDVCIKCLFTTEIKT